MVMNAFYGIGIVSSVVYGMLVDGTYWKIYTVLTVLYLVFVLCSRNKRDNPKRKTIMAATWNGKQFSLI